MLEATSRVSCSQEEKFLLEIAVTFAVLWSIAVQAADDTREDAEFLARIVTHDANLDTDCLHILDQSRAVKQFPFPKAYLSPGRAVTVGLLPACT